MNIVMNDKHIVNISQIKEFAKVNILEFKVNSKKEKYEWINKVLNMFKYFSLKKKDRGIVRKYIKTMTGIKDSQLTVLINKKKDVGVILLSSKKKHSFPRIYDSLDTALLAKTDNLHLRPSGPCVKAILERQCNVFNKKEYENLGNISVSHIYNLRESRQYLSSSTTFEKTCAVSIKIGERRKPDPLGYLRVDSVHQGDLDKEKGVYHINMVDEVTQSEIIGTVERISEKYMLPLLIDLLLQYPFIIVNFHSDNGSEYINKKIADLLNRLLIKQTKSRSRHANDNALVEGKNGSVVRKHIGYIHIQRGFAKDINNFCKKYLNPYLNFHHPCGFATIYIDEKGKEKKKYNIYMTPYDKFKSLPNCEKYLKPGITLEMLDKIAYAKSDNDFAEEMQKAKEELFKNFKHVPQKMLTFTSFVSCRLLD
ncbi:MAG: integrase [Candidatus ainarchaeum sp.]|nr:integrase [Candidatus ainarchaeum sp.]